MDLRDALHGSIQIYSHEIQIIDSAYFQRLRHIKQLGFGEYSFPGATHNRYIHSLGAMEIATRAWKAIYQQKLKTQLNSKSAERFLILLRLAALLHDIGHGPLSHTTEMAMPPVHTLKLPTIDPTNKRQAHHEDYTIKIILESCLSPLLEDIGALYGFKPIHIASLI